MTIYLIRTACFPLGLSINGNEISLTGLDCVSFASVRPTPYQPKEVDSRFAGLYAEECNFKTPLQPHSSAINKSEVPNGLYTNLCKYQGFFEFVNVLGEEKGLRACMVCHSVQVTVKPSLSRRSELVAIVILWRTKDNLLVFSATSTAEMAETARYAGFGKFWLTVVRQLSDHNIKKASSFSFLHHQAFGL
jgi:hypothetical protein